MLKCSSERWVCAPQSLSAVPRPPTAPCGYRDGPEEQPMPARSLVQWRPLAGRAAGVLDFRRPPAEDGPGVVTSRTRPGAWAETAEQATSKARHVQCQPTGGTRRRRPRLGGPMPCRARKYLALYWMMVEDMQVPSYCSGLMLVSQKVCVLGNRPTARPPANTPGDGQTAGVLVVSGEVWRCLPPQ